MSKRNNGELKLVADITGFHRTTIQKVSAGTRRNQAITWAITRADELREEMHRQLREQLEREYQEKFGKADE